MAEGSGEVSQPPSKTGSFIKAVGHEAGKGLIVPSYFQTKDKWKKEMEGVFPDGPRLQKVGTVVGRVLEGVGRFLGPTTLALRDAVPNHRLDFAPFVDLAETVGLAYVAARNPAILLSAKLALNTGTYLGARGLHEVGKGIKKIVNRPQIPKLL